MTKFRVRFRLKAEPSISLYSEGMTKEEAFDMCPIIAAHVQVAAIDVINPRGYVVEDGVPTRKARS